VILGGKTIAVAGAGPGLGGEVARLALRDGAQVVIGARTAGKLAELARRLDPSGTRVAAEPLDVGDAASRARFAEAAERRFGGVDAVVAVAALDALFGNLESTPVEDWGRALEVNVVGTLQLVRAFLPALRRRGAGAIVLIGSQSYNLPPKNPQIAYAASKGALMSAMYHMAAELGRDRIRVNTVVPTWMWGPPVQGYVRWQAKQRGVAEEAVVAENAAAMPLGEIPADEDVAEAVIFLCSDRARMITGHALPVNAGQVMG
jgi:NAD(P)-dependent dehydrogenase (short-subunit alcohol dehydrogenase family)